MAEWLRRGLQIITPFAVFRSFPHNSGSVHATELRRFLAPLRKIGAISIT
jgi:hypothetical protein